MPHRLAVAALTFTVLSVACAPDTPLAVHEGPQSQSTTAVPPRTSPAPLYLAATDDERGRPDHYIVKLTDEFVPKDNTYTAAAEILGIAEAEGRKVWPTFRGFYARIPKDHVDKVRDHPLVEYVEEDRAIEAASSSVHTYAGVGSVASLPDTQTAAPWHLDRIDQDHLPLDSTFTYEYSGDGVNIYVIDSGIRESHDEFGGRALNSYQAELWDPVFDDCRGHGTAVASAAAGATYGVAKDARLFGIRVQGCGPLIWLGDILDGMEWVANHHIDPAVATISVWGHDLNPLRSWPDAAEDLIDAGVVMVKSAGNDNENPCDDDDVRTVRSVLVAGALAYRSDSRAAFSNYGPCVDLYAPGDGMYLAGIDSDSDSAWVSGTSFAAPLVAGAAAIYLDQYPNDLPNVVHRVLKGGATPNNVIGSHVDRILYVNQPRITLVLWEGPAEVGAGEVCTWEARVDGGRPPFTYAWSGILSGTTRSVSGSITEGGELTLRVEDSTGMSDTYTEFVTVGSLADCLA